jgi:hypothetical protein
VTAKTDFTDEEWELLREAPATAGMFVLTASGGGTLRETWALAKSYTEARKQRGASEVLDALVSEKPEAKRYGSVEEMEREGLDRLRQAVQLLEQKATPEEVADYKQFALDVATRVAEAHKEEGATVSPAEQAAIDKVTTALGA